VPKKYECNPELGRWVVNQRFLKKGKDSLHKDRVAKLESIGFVWDKRNGDWDFRFEQLVEYKRTHGNSDVPFHYELNQELGRWVVNQRYLVGKNSLRKDRAAKLESIGFTFAGQEANKSDDWVSFFEELRDYLRVHGDCNVPEKYDLNPSFGEWVRKQRDDYSLQCGGHQSAMTAEREAKLNVLGFSWVSRHSPAGSYAPAVCLVDCSLEVVSSSLATTEGPDDTHSLCIVPVLTL
jgi:hypothetical protein